MKKLTLILFIVMLLSSSLLTAKEFVIGVENINYSPYYNGSIKEYQGFAREMLDLFGEENGHTFTYKPYPIVRLFHNLVQDKIDFKYPDNKHWAADIKGNKKIFYSDKTAKYFEGVMVLPAKIDYKIENIKTIGLIQGFTAYPYLDLIKAGKIKISENPNYKNLLLQGLNERVDGVFTNIAVGKLQLALQFQKPMGLLFNKDLPFIEDYYYLSTTKHPEIIKEFNKFLKTNSAKIIELKKKYKIKY